MKKAYILFLFCGFIFVAGCATEQPLYYWGNYSHSLYKFKKGPNEENLSAHKVVLLNIIEESNKANKRIPPGVCCEYGYLLLKEGKNKDAMYYFDLEEKTYPESKVFLDRLREKMVIIKGE